MILRLLAILLVFGFGYLFQNKDKKPTNDEDTEHLILEGTLLYIEKVHFEPRPLDDSLSADMFDDYLTTMDYGKKYLLQEEVDQLKKYEYKIDDELRDRNFTFFNLSYELWENAYARVKPIYESVISSPINVMDQEMMELDPEKTTFAKSEAELTDKWKKQIEYEVVSRVENELVKQKDKEEQKTKQELIDEALEEIKKSYELFFVRMDELERKDFFDNYMNSLVSVQDPHSSYLNPKDKQDFDMSMSGSLEGIGATLQRDKEYTKIASIVAGGPAWKGKELEESDLILKVAQGEDGEWIDVVGWRLDDVVQKIRGKAGTTVRLTIKKPDGDVKEIKIVREKVEVGQQFAKSFLLEDGQGDKIGLIKLPRFYSDFEKHERNCADDVKKEIEKLQKDNVKGIVIDLRNNPGGSLSDVVNMSGLFIQKGPIVQVQGRETKKNVLDDTNKNVSYDGPLVVLTNYFSASASEIFAGALQDYGRAVIIGTNSTYGKGTVQRFYSLDRIYRGKLPEPLGDLKMTFQKYYRVTGSSVQKKGVIPDIVIPDRYLYMDIGEKEYENAIEWSEITPVEFGQDVFRFDLDKIKQQSQARMESDEIIALRKDQAKTYKELSDDTDVSLNLDDFVKEQDRRESIFDSYKDQMEEEEANYIVSFGSEDEMVFKTDSIELAKYKRDMKPYENDYFLKEAIAVIHDQNSQQTRKIAQKD